MKNIGKLAVLGAVITASSSFAFADTIQLVSYATGSSVTASAGDSVNGVTYYTGDSLSTTFIPGSDVTTPAPNQTPTLTNPTGTSYNFGTSPGTWANALHSPLQSDWIGAYSTAHPGGANVAQGFYTFQTSFTAIGGLYNGSLSMMSDDTVEVILDYGTADALILNGFSALGTDYTCADHAPTCTSPFTDTISNASLLAGTNTLTFIVEQGGDETHPNQDPSGLDYDGSLTRSTAPEPSSLMLLGTGLVGAAGLRFRRRQASVL